jgi:putative sigma-54 modulation protein
MKINTIKATNTDLTPAIAEYVQKKLSSLDKVIDKNDESATVSIEVGLKTKHHQQGDIFFAEVNLHVSGGDFYAMAEGSDLYSAIDEVKDEIIREVNSYRSKRRKFLRRGQAIVKNLMKGVGEQFGKIKRFRK